MEAVLETFRTLIQSPPRIYQRHRRTWHRLVLAAGWTALFVLCERAVRSVPALEGSPLPAQWRAVLAAMVFVAGVWNPAAAYLAFMLAVAYPLYLISSPVMILGLAALLLFAPLVARARWGSVRRRRRATGAETGVLFAALLILGAPLLASAGLAPVLPLLAGLWWGSAAGAATGGLSALWLKVCAGIAGHSVDLWAINGWAMPIAPIYERLHAADALQAMRHLVAPLHTDPAGWLTPVGSESSALLAAGSWGPGAQIALFNLLQVLAWTAAGTLAGAVREGLERRFAARSPSAIPWRTQLLQGALSLGPALLALWAGYVAVPAWLQMSGARWFQPLWLPAAVMLAGLLAWSVDGMLRYVGQPLAEERTRRQVRVRQVGAGQVGAGKRTASRAKSSGPAPWPSGAGRLSPEYGSSAQGAPVSPAAAPQNEGQAKPQGQDREGIIMIEID
jgi:hypothetical protein